MLTALKLPKSLYWLVPVVLGGILEITFFVVPFVPREMTNQHKEILWVLVPFCFIAPIGGWWAVYQCVRYEERPAKYILLVMIIPLGFIWYYFERHHWVEAQSSVPKLPAT